MTISAFARPRLGLLGNPSDGYGGRVIAVTFTDFAAEVTWSEASRFSVAMPSGVCAADSLAELIAVVGDSSLPPGSDLVLAALRRWLAAEPGRSRNAARRPFRLAVRTDIPRQVGLSGSSALVIATLRVLASSAGESWDPPELARTAWAVETDDLGIVAGPQDRVVQAYEGLVDMNFSGPWSPDAFQCLDVSLLPPLFVAWNPEVGTSSGAVHDDVRARWQAGDPEVCEVMKRFPVLAKEGRGCLEAGDHEGFARRMDENFDLRARIWQLSERDREMVVIGRRLGAGVKFAGSGGAVVGTVPAGALDGLREAYARAGFEFLVPEVPGGA